MNANDTLQTKEVAETLGLHEKGRSQAGHPAPLESSP